MYISCYRKSSEVTNQTKHKKREYVDCDRFDLLDYK